ncbi:MobF family relaxase [Nocardia alba]|uniref:Conjugative relaxase-like TrwC/TraI family protein n=1 Tax=Nocardia alba TaxID=225051 RepID=A0A4R1F7K6_9NOCA|nr:MobF family relaxase [Nocardia alba]TCJ89923.1 conjugative relaxase-like TrwC/TraI family protein [Nocardia alba]
MSLAKLSAGEGFEYYTRVIATHDANERHTTGIDDYYSEKGESPGVWLGAGLVTLGIDEGDRVTEAQMRALLGEGLHPNADAIIDAAVTEQVALGAKFKDAFRYALKKAQLGRPYSTFTTAPGSYRHECAKGLTDWNTLHGRDPRTAVPAEERRRIRTEVALRMFTDDVGRAPLNSRELSGWIARASRPSKTAIAGFDLTFSPVKSVSALWAVASREVAEQIEKAHHAAIRDVISYIESEVLYTRVGRNSVRQVEVAGLIVTAFDHRDSRAGDPDLHTHLVVSNNVLRADGKWGAIDGRMIYRYNVTCSEMYNTRLEAHLEASLGLVFADRGEVVDKRPVREVVGVDAELAREWSKRGRAVRSATAKLSAQFQADHGREPTALELLSLSQQATLSTRASKHAARSNAEQRATWRADAIAVLGSEAAVEQMIHTALSQQIPDREQTTTEWITQTAVRSVEVVSQTRATWQHHHIRAEVERQVRGRIAPDRWASVVAQVTETALAEPISIPRGVHDLAPTVNELSRGDGTSVYTTARSTLYTSPQIIAAETRLVDAGLRHDGHRITVAAIDAATIEYAANNNGLALNTGQAAMVRTFATSGARLQVGLAPAGAGKTLSMRVLADAWTAQGGTVIGLAPTATAAEILARDIDAPASTVDLLVSLAHRLDAGELGDPPTWLTEIGPQTLVILDEAAKTATLTLDSAVSWLLERGASIRAIGDHRQLSSVAAGGVIRDIVAHAGSADLTTVMRFTDLGERAASLAVRDGDPAGLAYYTDHDRIRTGSLDAVVEQAYLAWAADIDAGRDSALLAPTRELVTDLNSRARTDRLADTDTEVGTETVLADGLSASAGDIICTRLNNRRLRISKTDYVRNGARWTVQTVHEDGRITAAHIGSGRRVTLPADYVSAHTQLGYATTIDSAQGMTVDTCHAVLTGRESRAQLYVAVTRGRDSNQLWLSTHEGTEPNLYEYESVRPPTALDVLTGVLGRDGVQISAATAHAQAHDPRHQLAGAIDSYLDALGVAAETHYGADQLATLDTAAEQLLPGLTGAPAYPVLRQHLVTLALNGDDPIQALTTAIGGRELDTAADPAAVLDWRIDPSGYHSGHDIGLYEMGPLGWLPGVPAQLRQHAEFGPHLAARATQIHALKDQVTDLARTWTDTNTDQAPLWAQPLLDHPDLLGPLAIWRAAHGVANNDRRPTGPTVPANTERDLQRTLDENVANRLGDTDADIRRWTGLADELNVTGLTEDPVWPLLAAELSRAEDGGRDIADATRAALDARPLPAEQPAAALRWRLAGDLDDLAPAPAVDTTSLQRQIQIMEHDPLRRLSDADLSGELARLRGKFRQEQHAAVPAMLDALENDRVGTVTAAHARLDADRVRRAQAELAAFADEQQAAQNRITAINQQIRQIRARQTPRWGRRQRATEIEAKQDELRDSETAYHAYLERERAILDAAASDGVGQRRWQQILDAADDVEARAAELDAAHRHDQDRAENRYRRRQINDELRGQLRAVVGEHRRRGELPDLDRDREAQARDYLDGPEAAIRATGVLDQTPTGHEPNRYQQLPYEPDRDRGYDLDI